MILKYLYIDFFTIVCVEYFMDALARSLLGHDQWLPLHDEVGWFFCRDTPMFGRILKVDTQNMRGKSGNYLNIVLHNHLIVIAKTKWISWVRQHTEC